MAKIKKSVLTNDWLEIKEMYESNTNGSKEYGENFEIGGEFDELTRKFLDKIATLTKKLGFECTVDNIKWYSMYKQLGNSIRANDLIAIGELVNAYEKKLRNIVKEQVEND